MLLWLSMSVMLVLGSLGMTATALAETVDKQRIFDEAGLLSDYEVKELEAYAAEVSARWSTDVLVYTTENTSGADVMLLTQQFYDDRAPGYDKPHGNTAILTLDMYNRELYLAGFYKAETYLNDRRLDQINDAVTSSLSGGAYREAFYTYMDMVDRFMAVEPSAEEYESGGSGYVSAEQEYASKLLTEGVQIFAALAIAGVAVFIMVRNAGGKVTVNRKTYENPAQMAIRGQVDQYSHTTVTRTKIERNTGGRGGGGGGGGITRGGHSHSGSRGKF